MARSRHHCQRISLALHVAAFAGVGCDRESTTARRHAAANDAIRAFVTIAPQARIVKRIAGEAATVDVLIPAGQSHHTYEPTPKRIGELTRADVYFLLGVAFEAPLVERIRAGQGQLRFVDCGQGVARRSFDAGSDDHDSEGGEGADHSHGHQEGDLDPHYWLDPRAMRAVAEAVRDVLSQIRPGATETFRRNCAALVRDLDDVHGRIAAKLAPYAGREFYVFHPAFGYFADAYGLVQVSVEHEGKEPTGARLAALQERMVRGGVTTLFVEPQFASSAAGAVAGRVGAKVVTIDPLAEDYLENLETIADKIAAALSEQTARRGEHSSQAPSRPFGGYEQE